MLLPVFSRGSGLEKIPDYPRENGRNGNWGRELHPGLNAGPKCIPIRKSIPGWQLLSVPRPR